MGAMAGSVASGAWTALGVWALASAVAAFVVAVRRVAGDTGVANALREASIRVEFEGTLLPTVWPRRSIVELRNRGGTVWVHHVSLAGLAVHDHEGHHVHVGSPAPGEECLPNQPLPFPSHRGSSFYCMWPGKD